MLKNRMYLNHDRVYRNPIQKQTKKEKGIIAH